MSTSWHGLRSTQKSSERRHTSLLLLRIDGKSALAEVPENPSSHRGACSRPYVKTMTPEEVIGAHEQADAYREWFQTQILPSDGNGASSAVMVDRWTWRLNYRDTLKEYVMSSNDALQG